MMLRFVAPLLFAVMVLLPLPAAAVSCTNGFQCDPHTMACFTSWIACKYEGGGPVCVPYGVCSGNPSTCYELEQNDPQCNPGVPGLVCNWAIGPNYEGGATGCTLQATPAVLLEGSFGPLWEKKQGMHSYALELEMRIALYRGHLKILMDGIAPGTPLVGQVRAVLATLIGFQVIRARVARFIADPPNPDYMELPPVGVSPVEPPLTADATLTQAQANVMNAWLAKMQRTTEHWRRLDDTMDNLSGAILAAQASTAGAVPWVRKLARHADVAMASVSQRGLTEIAARTTLTGAFPSVPIAASCLTATDAAHAMGHVAVQGGTSYELGLIKQALTNVCSPAGTWPGSVTSAAAADTAVYASLAPFGLANHVCVKTGWCSSLTTTTITPKPTQVAGQIKQIITVTASDGPYTVTNGTLVTITSPSFPPQTLSLTNGKANYNQAAPTGSVHALTAAFSAQLGATLGASSAVVTITVP